jgi:hypothetical protein
MVPACAVAHPKTNVATTTAINSFTFIIRLLRIGHVFAICNFVPCVAWLRFQLKDLCHLKEMRIDKVYIISCLMVESNLEKSPGKFKNADLYHVCVGASLKNVDAVNKCRRQCSLRMFIKNHDLIVDTAISSGVGLYYTMIAYYCVCKTEICLYNHEELNNKA